MSDTSMREFLSEHPRMIGVLFTITLLLSQAGNAVAANSGSLSGP